MLPASGLESGLAALLASINSICTAQQREQQGNPITPAPAMHRGSSVDGGFAEPVLSPQGLLLSYAKRPASTSASNGRAADTCSEGLQHLQQPATPAAGTPAPEPSWPAPGAAPTTTPLHSLADVQPLPVAAPMQLPTHTWMQQIVSLQGQVTALREQLLQAEREASSGLREVHSMALLCLAEQSDGVVGTLGHQRQSTPSRQPIPGGIPELQPAEAEASGCGLMEAPMNARMCDQVDAEVLSSTASTEALQQEIQALRTQLSDADRRDSDAERQFQLEAGELVEGLAREHAALVADLQCQLEASRSDDQKHHGVVAELEQQLMASQLAAGQSNARAVSLEQQIAELQSEAAAMEERLLVVCRESDGVMEAELLAVCGERDTLSRMHQAAAEAEAELGMQLLAAGNESAELQARLDHALNALIPQLQDQHAAAMAGLAASEVVRAELEARLGAQDERLVLALRREAAAAAAAESANAAEVEFRTAHEALLALHQSLAVDIAAQIEALKHQVRSALLGCRS